MASGSRLSRRIDLSMTGDKELQAAFNQLQSVSLQKRIVTAGLRVAQQTVTLPHAKARAPVGITARLRSTLRVMVEQFTKGRRRGRFGVVVSTGKRSQLDIPADAPGFYPAHQEMGTVDMAPAPFLRPALYDNTASLLRVFRATVWRLLRGDLVRMGRRRVRLTSEGRIR